MKLAFEEHGMGKPVVLLHGFPLSRRMWEPQINALVAANCRVVLPDLRGFGESTLSSDVSKMEDSANDVDELLDDLQIDKAIIGGLSMGGYVTLNLFRHNPERFSAMILADTTALADTAEKRQTRLELIEKIKINGSKILIDEMLWNLISDSTKENNPNLVEHLQAMYVSALPASAIAALRGMAQRIDHTQMLSQIEVPTLLIFGEEDRLTNIETANKLHSRIANSRLVIIERMGHYSNLENPESFNNALIDFVKSLKI